MQHLSLFIVNHGTMVKCICVWDRGCMCIGALGKWKQFSSEFIPGGAIAMASSDMSAQTFMRATNDKNEGALGSFRVQRRHRPSMTLPQHNAHAMYKMNGTKSYMCTLTPAQCKLFCKKNSCPRQQWARNKAKRSLSQN